MMRERLIYIAGVIAAIAAAAAALAKEWPGGNSDKKGNSGSVEKA